MGIILILITVKSKKQKSMKPITYFVARNNVPFRIYISRDTHMNLFVQILGQKAVRGDAPKLGALTAYNIETESVLRGKRLQSGNAAHIQWWIESTIQELLKPKSKSKKVKA